MTQQRKKCGKGGFTLVELVVTLVILSILFAIAVPSLLGYIHLSQFRKNESYAKTMYLSAESELTYLRTGGEWESFCSKVKKEGVLNQSFDESDEDPGSALHCVRRPVPAGCTQNRFPRRKMNVRSLNMLTRMVW